MDEVVITLEVLDKWGRDITGWLSINSENLSFIEIETERLRLKGWVTNVCFRHSNHEIKLKRIGENNA